MLQDSLMPRAIFAFMRYWLLEGHLMRYLMVFLFLFVGVGSTWAHSGGTDQNGCHHDRKYGGYHCH
ncbi:YHYH domain-containing protein [Mesorhizobium marinum]|uniref:YHYH domain-containing protein n=1 Tax=Mesorhizobium marinum TaxID=3228790 RepID=UPI003465EAF2